VAAPEEIHSGSASLGKVFLVGAGPGDPGLITVRAVECLRRADVVLYDYLVNPAILQHAPAAAERICLGHHRTGRELSQQEINARMIDQAGRGKVVVRLKGGDPAIFGRLGEETAALCAAGIAYEIVPGVTAALAAAAYADIPITHGEQASAVALVTGHERRGKGSTSRLDYAALARFPGTLVFYMGVTSAAEWSGALIGHGKSPDTPVAIVQRCSQPSQRVVRCTLETVAAVVSAYTLRPPAVIIVGEVVDLAPDISRFTAHGEPGSEQT
jgi:uroporphyrinogen III methyltransferase/synthase